MLIPYTHRLIAIFVFLAKLYHTKLKSTVRHPGVGVENALCAEHSEASASCSRPSPTMYREKVRPGTGRESGLGHLQVSREGRRPGVTIPAGDAAPTGLSLSQNLTSGAFHNHYEIFFSSCKSIAETSYQARIYATTGLS
jgi:hypothetical protein